MYSQIYISNLKNETLSRLNYVKSIGAGGPASRRIKSSNLSDLVFLCAEGMTTQSYLNLQHVPFMSANRTKTNGSTEKTHRPVTERNLYGKKVDLTGRETPKKAKKKHRFIAIKAGVVLAAGENSSASQALTRLHGRPCSLACTVEKTLYAPCRSGRIRPGCVTHDTHKSHT